MIKIEKPILTIKESPILFNNNNYLFATQIAKLGGKRFSDWKRYATTNKIIKDISMAYEKDLILIQVIRGGSHFQGSWIHPILLPHLIRWCIPSEIDSVEVWAKEICDNNFVPFIENTTVNTDKNNNSESESEDNINSQKENTHIFHYDGEIIGESSIINNNSIIQVLDPETDINDKQEAKLEIALVDKIFDFTNKQISVYGSFDKPYFRAKDIASILGYSKTEKAISNHVRDKNKLSFKELLENLRPPDLGGLKKYSYNELNTLYINESGLYELIFSSKMENAIEFKDWVFDEVLPSIRKQGQENVIHQLELKNRNLKNKLEKTNWLHTTAKYNATFEIRTNKMEGIYLGAHPTESEHFIHKVGKSINSYNRERALSTSTSSMNKFEMLKTYETYIDLSIDTERFIHAILSPLSANVNGVRKEHFIAHHIFLNSIITNVINDVDKYVLEVNNYIILLKNNNYDYEKVSSILSDNYNIINDITALDIKVVDKKTETPVDLNAEKICNSCGLSKTTSSYEIYRKDKRAVVCIACRNLLNIQCNKCKISKLGINFRVKPDGKRQQGCVDCVPNITLLIKCQKCEISKSTDSYDFDEKGRRYRYCKLCKLPTRKCLRCKTIKHNYELTPANENRKYCDDCYTHVQLKVKFRDCIKCCKKLPKEIFSDIDDLKRNRICDPCRGIHAYTA